MIDKKFAESKLGCATCLILVVIIVFIFSKMLFFSSENSQTNTSQTPSVKPQTTDNSFLGKAKVVLQSQEERFGCENGKIENLTSADLIKTKNTFKVMEGIRTNIVEYPLNKSEVMIEYCFRIANTTSELDGLWLTVKFLDKDKNVLAEEDERVADIPGKRIKTVYGSKIVDVRLANEMTNISISK
jgi:hypothetical protein